jgi:hypothetical protein
VQADQDAPHCFDALDKAQDGELAIVCYELHSRHAQRIAASFAEWITKFFIPCVR